LLDNNLIPKRTNPYREPFLTKYNLYPLIGRRTVKNNKNEILDLILWLLFLADGKNHYLKYLKK